MIPSVEPQIAVSSLPAWARRLPSWQQALLAVAGVLALAVSSRVSIPVGPVPVTMQTLAVSLVGAILGWRLGGACVVVWLLAGAAGLPVLAGGSGGLAKFLGPSAGYLFAFPLAAAAIGWLVERGWDRGRLLRLLGVMLFGNGICLGVGALWLAHAIGLHPALMKGVVPFLPGAFLKSLLGALLIALFAARVRGR